MRLHEFNSDVDQLISILSESSHLDESALDGIRNVLSKIKDSDHVAKLKRLGKHGKFALILLAAIGTVNPALAASPASLTTAIQNMANEVDNSGDLRPESVQLLQQIKTATQQVLNATNSNMQIDSVTDILDALYLFDRAGIADIPVPMIDDIKSANNVTASAPSAPLSNTGKEAVEFYNSHGFDVGSRMDVARMNNQIANNWQNVHGELTPRNVQTIIAQAMAGDSASMSKIEPILNHIK